MDIFTPLDGSQIRQQIDTEQAYSAIRAAQLERDQRFRGSMSWKKVRGRDYLYRKTGERWKSLGGRSRETEIAFDSFQSGRAAARERIASLDSEIRRMAPINRAMRLGRMPWTAARLLRRLDRRQLLGKAIKVVGTHALFAYERMAGGHFHQSQVATADIDLLYDARDRLGLVAPDTREEGLRGLLSSIDDSFEPIAPGAFRAVNSKGFMVDLIGPMPSSPSLSRKPARIGTDAADLTAAEIEGLTWLQNCPQIQQTVIDDRGYPLRLDVPDPRAFALHKLWVSERPDRDRMKARRDAAQAIAVAALILRYLPQLRFDGDDLRALPAVLRARTSELLDSAKRQDIEDLDTW
jgi:hypothetical protein